jgi:hypothetical protein
MNEDLEFDFIAEILDEDENIKPIEMGGGLIEYRKYAWALKFLEEKALRLKEYKEQVIVDIDKAITSKENTIEHLRGEIERAMLADQAVDTTSSGGKSLQLPDIATISISKLQDKIDITNPELVLDELGDEFKVVKVSLDTTKAKKHILESGKLPKGAERRQDRTMSVRFKK